MKKILGLDLGTNSIGWAMVNEAENAQEKSSIIKLGVRTIHYDNFVSTETGKESKEPVKDFCGGKGISCNAGRTLKRSMRRNLQRYKLRRENLIAILKEHHFITDVTILSENGNNTTFETYRLRAKAATEEISLQEFARVLLMINKKRGYKSSRKAKSTEEGQLIDGMEVAKQLYENNLTPGQLSLNLLKQGKKYLPDFYRSDLQTEFDKLWNFQKQFYPELLSDTLKEDLKGKNKSQTWAICAKPFKIVGIKRNTKGAELKFENYQWRTNALTEKIDLEELAIVLQEVNGQINNASGYLGNISDRSKELYFNNMTVGQFQMAQLDKNPNYSLKNQVFYRQDYLNEFERIWETQAKFHKELTPELKKEIRDIVIFYQRPLKSQKGLISFCEFESQHIEVEIDGKKKTKTIGLRACPKSSPLFQEFKIWQILNNVQVISEKSKRYLSQEEKEALFVELNYKEKLSKTDALKLFFKNNKELDLNFKELEGNRTQAELFKAYQTIVEITGHGEHDFSKLESSSAIGIVTDVFT
ncbi:MAG: type II CRISPR RNA-guided endonuclease Cas9, partial [Bacteroidales bacterium]|nr:type II CRISPR RNA-guided endonuclease Cas9 [Bacteroidales bacterium]